MVHWRLLFAVFAVVSAVAVGEAAQELRAQDLAAFGIQHAREMPVAAATGAKPVKPDCNKDCNPSIGGPSTISRKQMAASFLSAPVPNDTQAELEKFCGTWILVAYAHSEVGTYDPQGIQYGGDQQKLVITGTETPFSPFALSARQEGISGLPQSKLFPLYWDLNGVSHDSSNSAGRINYACRVIDQVYLICQLTARPGNPYQSRAYHADIYHGFSRLRLRTVASFQ